MSRGISVLFELRRAETRPGEFISVVGNIPELGTWDVYTSAVPLQTGMAYYPLWAMNGPMPIALSRASGECSPLQSDSDDSDGESSWDEVSLKRQARQTPETFRFEY